MATQTVLSHPHLVHRLIYLSYRKHKSQWHLDPLRAVAYGKVQIETIFAELLE
jgi:hypothetical protein